MYEVKYNNRPLLISADLLISDFNDDLEYQINNKLIEYIVDEYRNQIKLMLLATEHNQKNFSIHVHALLNLSMVKIYIYFIE